MVSACLKLILDDILVVFTPLQLQVLLTFSKELSEVCKVEYGAGEGAGGGNIVSIINL